MTRPLFNPSDDALDEAARYAAGVTTFTGEHMVTVAGEDAVRGVWPPSLRICTRCNLPRAGAIHPCPAGDCGGVEFSVCGGGASPEASKIRGRSKSK